MIKVLQHCLLLVVLLLTYINTSAQNVMQKNDHLISGRLGLNFINSPNRRSLNLNMSIDWHYVVSTKWSLGLGLSLTKTSLHSHDLQYGENSFEEEFILSPALIASRLFHIDEKWLFALTQEVNYFQSNQLMHIGYNLYPVIYFKLKPHWLISARTNLANITFNRPDYDLNATQFSISIHPSLKTFSPSFSLSYLL